MLFYSRISHYSIADTSDTVYVIGGMYTKRVVAGYTNDQWRRLPDLKQDRTGHGSITIGDRIVIIGGKSGTSR